MIFINYCMYDRSDNETIQQMMVFNIKTSLQFLYAQCTQMIKLLVVKKKPCIIVDVTTVHIDKKFNHKTII